MTGSSSRPRAAVSFRVPMRRAVEPTERPGIGLLQMGWSYGRPFAKRVDGSSVEPYLVGPYRPGES